MTKFGSRNVQTVGQHTKVEIGKFRTFCHDCGMGCKPQQGKLPFTRSRCVPRPIMDFEQRYHKYKSY